MVHHGGEAGADLVVSEAGKKACDGCSVEWETPLVAGTPEMGGGRGGQCIQCRDVDPVPRLRTLLGVHELPPAFRMAEVAGVVLPRQCRQVCQGLAGGTPSCANASAAKDPT